MIEFEKLPHDIQNKMLERQVEAGNPRSPNLFRIKISASKSGGGFDWDDSFEGEDFWMEIICNGYTDHYYGMYLRSPIKPQYEGLYKRTFKQNRILTEAVDTEKIRELNLEYILLK